LALQSAKYNVLSLVIAVSPSTQRIPWI
jgi:hypothetical protein